MRDDVKICQEKFSKSKTDTLEIPEFFRKNSLRAPKEDDAYQVSI